MRRFLLIALVVITSCVPGRVTEPSSGQSASVSAQDLGGGITAEVTKVVDGDSIEVTLGDGSDDRVRLVGLNANELTECFGTEAGDWLRQRIAGRSIVLVPGNATAPDERDRYGRRLAYVFLEDRLINAELIEEGLVLGRAQSEHPLADEFEQLESAAVEAKRGLWARDACGESAGPGEMSIAIVELRSNARGRDDQNPNDEWIVIENSGDSPVSLADWTIKDETTSHRFTFGDVTLDAGARIRLRSGCLPDDQNTGNDTDDHDPATDHYWCDGDPIWNNGGDTGFVLDPAGNIVDSLRYND